MRRVLMAAVLGSAVAACERSVPIDGPLIRDSLGVAVVEHGGLSLSSVESWRLASEPLLSVGTVEGSAAYELYGVIDAHRRKDGSIAVVDRSSTLRVYDSLGAHRWTAGGRGEGPGEFQWPQRIAELGDASLVVWDARLGRFSVFVDPGRHVRTTAVESTAGITAALGLSGAARLLVEKRVLERGALQGRPAITVRSDLFLLDIGTAELHPLGRRHHSTQYQEVDEDGAFSPAIFEASAVLAPAADGFWYGEGKRYELRRSTAAGGLVRVVRWQGPDQRIAASEFDAVLRTWTSGADATPESRRRMQAYGRTHPRADQFPSYEELLTDAQGNLWVRDFVRDHEDDGVRRWIVFSSDGARVLGRFEHGEKFRPVRVSPESVLGVERDDLDVERVVLRRLIRGPG